MKWIPEWLGKAYSLLYINKGSQVFEFEDAKKILGIDDKKMVSKILSQLRNRGFLISKRDPADPRRKFFKLISPESIVFAFGVQNLTRDKTLFAKIQAASKYLDCVIGGAYASFRYHRYSTPGKIDIHVNKEDLEKWVALLTDKGTAISIDAIPSEKTGKENVHIHSDFTSDMLKESTIINGIRYLTPEILIIEGLKSEDRFSLTDALAILIAKRDKLDYEKILRLAEREGVTRKLGCVLEMINYEAGREMFPTRQIAEIQGRTDTSYLISFPKTIETAPFTEEEKEHYMDIGKRWNMKIYLSKASVSKIVTT
ncbi:MAG: hypothetical protein AOA65_0069 [Candidatus Bathyarchaeota archaeon BA1]|nr:MAG: hypothetical protein AOA65_0069 [Candidatus Bathyarchaeota archaeon BA1]